MPQTNLIKVLALESIHPLGYEILRNHNLILDEKLALTLEEKYKLVKDYDVLIIKSITKINSDLLKNAKNLKVIARAGAGLDNIDLNLCKDRNIKLIHTPDLNSNAAADFTVMQILNLVRKSFQAQDMVRNKDFIRDKLLGRDMSELTIGIIGFGNVGRRVVKRLESFESNIIIFDPLIDKKKIDRSVNFCDTIEEILYQSDVVSLHLPLRESTINLFDDDKFSKMKKNSIFINTSRGKILDEEALIRAIEQGIISYAALDVCEIEPPYNKIDKNFHNKILNNKKIVYTPHIGASTFDAQIKISEYLSNEIIKFFKINKH